MHGGFFSNIVLCLFLVELCPLLQCLILIKYFLVCSIQTVYFEELLLLYYLNARYLVDEVSNQRKMIFRFNHGKNNLKDTANY